MLLIPSEVARIAGRAEVRLMSRSHFMLSVEYRRLFLCPQQTLLIVLYPDRVSLDDNQT